MKYNVSTVRNYICMLASLPWIWYTFLICFLCKKEKQYADPCYSEENES